MYVELKNINKTFGNFKASDDVSFGIEKGQLVGLLGPSGSGKTTILRIIAGLEHQDSGDVFIDGKNVNDITASRRGIGFVFQNYALFPYLTVYDNIAYGLKVQKKSKKFIKERVKELLELVELPELEKRYPEQLSGGQKQRIAFARALAPNPQLLLLDEPFAAIDAKVRQELRIWLRDMITRIGITSIFVTHDQDEAIEITDQIIVTNRGRVEQVGTPMDIYRNPHTPFIAQFIGNSTLLSEYGHLKGFDADLSKPYGVVRPEYVKVSKYGTTHKYQSALEEGVVRKVTFRGDYTELTVDVNGFELKANHSLDDEMMSPGERVNVLIYQIYVFDDTQAYQRLNKNLDDSSLYYI